MCAIITYHSNNGPIAKQALSALVEANLHRGPHAWGISWRMDRKVATLKSCGSALDDLGEIWSVLKHERSWLLHMRYATVGDPGVHENNHPHPVGSIGAMIHNGTVSDVSAFRRLVDRRELKGESDSEVIAVLLWRLVSENRLRLSEAIVAALAMCEDYTVRPARHALAVLTGRSLLVATSGKRLYRRTGDRCTIVSSTIPPGCVETRWKKVPRMRAVRVD